MALHPLIRNFKREEQLILDQERINELAEIIHDEWENGSTKTLEDQIHEVFYEASNLEPEYMGMTREVKDE